MTSPDSGDSRPPGQGGGGTFRYASLGIELAAAIIGLTLAGVWLDARFGTQPAWTIVGAFVGIVGGMYNLIRQALAAFRAEERRAKGEQTGQGHGDDQDRG